MVLFRPQADFLSEEVLLLLHHFKLQVREREEREREKERERGERVRPLGLNGCIHVGRGVCMSVCPGRGVVLRPLGREWCCSGVS